MTNLNVTVLGGGSWGTTVASLVARNAPITLWARSPATVTEINTHHTNEVFLPGAKLPEKLLATTDLGKAVCGADVLRLRRQLQTVAARNGFRQLGKKHCTHSIRPMIRRGMRRGEGGDGGCGRPGDQQGGGHPGTRSRRKGAAVRSPSVPLLIELTNHPSAADGEGEGGETGGGGEGGGGEKFNHRS